MNHSFRPPAVPLVTVDPNFSVWSMNDHLYDDHTKHWTGERQSMAGFAVIDGQFWRFLGRVNMQDYCTPSSLESDESPTMAQTNLVVKPLSSIYTFEAGGVTLHVDFTTPLLLNDLDVLSRPVSYVTFHIASNDGLPHEVQVYFDITGEWCVHTTRQEVVWSRSSLGGNIEVMRMGTKQQAVLKRKGDHVRIDWGYVNLIVPEAGEENTVISSTSSREEFAQTKRLRGQDDTNMPRAVEEDTPVMACLLNFGSVEKETTRFLLLAYDDIYAVEYFHKPLPGYWRKNGESFEEMALAAVREYPGIMQRCAAFNEKLIEEATAAGGAKYADLLSLAYRQAINAHKLAADDNGDILFFSKECDSNGCMATVDVSYPSIPLFLLYNPELIKGMMRPIFRYATSEGWTYDFAPHDAGRFPQANGQAYGIKLCRQMPVEECGNMLIMMAAVCLAEGKADFAAEHWGLLSKWAAYLKENGLDPGNQLCTDDFAGHLAHNANLSIKAIMAIGSYAILCSMLGQTDEAASYRSLAKEMAAQWQRLAHDGDHYKLAFDAPGTWSLKYNLVWDVIFGLDLFAPEIRQTEISYYLGKVNRYGVPLDSRATYTKADWLLWVAAMTDIPEEFDRFVHPLWDFLNESKSRLPLSDWYYTIDCRAVKFFNRSVVGGFFIKLLKDNRISDRWRETLEGCR